MGSRTRANVVAWRAGIVAAMLATLACALMASTTLAATLAAGATATQAEREATLRGRSDAQLATLVARNEAEATRIGELLLSDDRRRDEILTERDVARGLLARFLADAYKQQSLGATMLGDLLASDSLHEAADRLRVAQVVGRHHDSLIRALDSAESTLQVSALERSQLIARLGAVQAALVDVRTEQSRRAVIRDEMLTEREAAQAVAADKKERAAAARVAATAPATGTLVASSPFVMSSGPPSAASIDTYLASKGSPMTGQGAAFMESGMRWRVDPRMLVAIAGAESNFGELICGPHNAWGWACPNDPADFGTWADGIDTVTRGLRNYYLDEGRTSVSLIQQKYCPVGAANDPTGLNSHWRDNVTRFLLEQGGNPAMVGPGPGIGSIVLPDFGGLGIAVD